MVQNPLSRKLAAVVVNDEDPLMMGRVQVRVEALHGEVPDAFLPWAIPVEMSQGYGTLDVPAVGHRVFVQLQNREGSELLYFGNILGQKDAKLQRVPKVFQENYPARKGFWDKYGNYMYRDMTDGSAVMYMANNIKFELDKKGNVTLIVDGGSSGEKHDQTKTESQGLVGDLTIRVKGNIHIAAKGNIYIEGAEVYLD